MRLDKYLADMGVATRSECRKMIKGGVVSVDGAVEKNPGRGVTEGAEVTVNGKAVAYEEYVYYMLNKPAGVISATEDPRQETVLDLLPEQRRRDLFPVGRLDRDTEGLLLITNDGALAHRLLSPKHHVDKVYFARVTGELTGRDVELFRAGLEVDETLTAMPAELRILSAGAVSEAEVTVREGKFHQVKRMFLAVGKEVTYLKRLSMGPLKLDSALGTGSYRRLSAEEVLMLKSL